MMSTNQVIINKELLEKIFEDLGNLLAKKNKNSINKCELIAVEKTSILLNYNFIETTYYLDFIDKDNILTKEIIDEMIDKYQLSSPSINIDFISDKSYSPNIHLYSTYYRSYANGRLEVRTIKDEYLLAMKIMSGRKYKNDYSDIYGIINYCFDNNHPINIEILEKAIIDLYGSLDVVDIGALEFSKNIILHPSSTSYLEIKNKEEEHIKLIEDQINKETKKSDVDLIISMLESNIDK